MNEQQYRNSMDLRQVVIDKISKNEHEQVLDTWLQPCGTYGCVAGDYALKKLGQKNIDFEIENFCANISTMNGSQIEFGFDPRIINEKGSFVFIFGRSNSGTLQQRLDYIEQSIIDAGYSLDQGNESIDVKSMIHDIMNDDSILINENEQVANHVFSNDHNITS